MTDLRSLARPSDENAAQLATALGERMRKERRAQDLTLQEVATRTQLSIGYLSDIEHGRRWPSSDVAGLIEKALERPGKRASK